MQKILLTASVFLFSKALFSQLIYPGTPTVGTQEVVFDYSVDKCNTIDIPDAPARVFRDASGMINLLATHYTNWRMTGTSFNNLTKDCTPVLDSDLDSDPSNFNDKQWIVSTYTEDGTTVHALLHDEYVPCGNANTCWYNGITYASSSDGGQNYSHTTAPSHLVAASPYQSPYPTSHAPFGIFGGSNIIKKDGYYYKMVQLEEHLLQDWGAGIIRTDDLSDPTSWRGWDGVGYNVVFVNPYTASGYDPADKVLAPVSRDRIGKMCTSLTFNTFFQKYMVVDYTVGEVNGSLVYGFYYALSDDLINWSSKRLIMQTASTWAAGGSNYASIIDHNDLTRNFEEPGQNCYLYFTKWNSGTYDRDLIRVPVSFTKETVNSFVVNSTSDSGDKTPGDGICLTSGGVCSLRAAMEESNARPTYDGYDTTALDITFTIPGVGVQTIPTWSGYLPETFYPLAINGYTQIGASENTNDFDQAMNTDIRIKIDAEDGGAHAFAFHCGNNVLRGLSIVNGSIDILYEDGYSKSRGNNLIEGCFLGMDTDGETPYACAVNINNQNGNTIGGTTNSARNLIGGGVIITKSDSNSVIGNFIGTTYTGASGSNNSAYGVQINDTSHYNVIGGATVLERNLISGGNLGVYISGGEAFLNEVKNNWIGIANDGASALGNQRSGIVLADNTHDNAISSNVIASNSNDEAGIWIDNAHANLITANFIGTNEDETAVLGNGQNGTFSAGIMLLSGSADNVIGGMDAAEGNVIANNNFGIAMYSNVGEGNALLSNSIYNNLEMAVDLGADYSVQGNDDQDSDSGPNGLQNFPVITSASVSLSQIAIAGTFNSTPSSVFTLQFFANNACDDSGNGEGKTLLGMSTVSTNSSGNAVINSTFNEVVAVGEYITALATDISNNTSEFSECRQTIQGGSGPSTPTISVNGSLTFCEGDEVVLTASSATSYLWSTGEMTQSITVTAADDYTVTVFDGGGLSATSAITTVVVNSLPTVLITGASTICAGETSNLVAVGGDTFVWMGGPSTANYSVSPSVTTTYTVTVTSASTSCINTGTKVVTVNQPAAPSFTSLSPLCAGETAPLLSTSSTDIPAVLGTWQPSTVDNNSSGTYVFTPNSGQCATSTSINVTVMQPVTPTFTAIPAICAGDISPILSTSSTDNPAISGTWLPASIDNTTSGVYIFTPDGGECATSSSLSVTVNPLPAAPIITQSGSVLQCTTATSYQWYMGGSPISNATMQSTTITQTGVYTVEVSDGNGCSVMSSNFNATVSGLNALSQTGGLVVAPNPSNGKFTVIGLSQEIESMKVFNAAGSVLLVTEGYQKEIDLGSAPKGVYFLKVELATGSVVKKLIVQ